MASPLDGREPGKNARGQSEPVRSELLQEVNDRIREVGRDSEGRVNLEFVCECGGSGCEAMVNLTGAEYDGIRLGTGRVLAPGHASALP